MDTQDFLRRILPERGLKVVATQRPAPYKGFKHDIVGTIEEMADLVAEIDGDGETVYHACASFAEQQVMVLKRDFKTGEMVEKPAVRVASNAAFCGSFWVDLDVEADNLSKYPDQRTAAVHLITSCATAGLPAPMIISSGYGVHAYWPIVEDIPAADWVKVATRLKALLAHLKVKQDPTRTADVASVLRPVGSSNRKNGGKRTVKLVRDCPDYPLRDFLVPLLEAVKRFGVSIQDQPAQRTALQQMFGNSSLQAKVDYPPSSADKVAQRCQAIQHFRDVMGNVEEPYWRAVGGVLKFTEEGDEQFHEWSKGHPDYNRTEAQIKLDRWQVGPASCATFECFGKCEGCPVKGTIKSPIQLGLELPKSDRAVEVKPRAAAVPAVEEAEPPVVDGKILLPELPEGMQKEFSYRGGNLFHRVPQGDDKPDKITVVCQEYIVPHSVIRPQGDARHGNKAIIKAWRFTLGNQREEITLPYTAIATGGKDLVTAFGDIGIIVEPAGMHSYMKSWMQHLKREAGGDTHSMERMGWNGENFVVGKKVYTPQGVGQAALASSLQMYQTAFTTQGSKEEWARLIDAAYNRPGQEQYQFMLACGFGAPLLRFVGDYRGVMVSAVSYKSGQGKTTAQRAAMSIYGDASRLETAYGRQTQNALYERLGAMGNLPFMIDELSNVEGKELADMAYHVSQGVQKDRLAKDGSLRAQREPWQTLVLTSGNRSVISALAAEGAQREPEMRRVFEFNFDVVSDLGKTEADRIFNELSKHYGVAGEVYVDFIVRNREVVEKAVALMQENLNKRLGLRREERFWGAALTAALTGLHFANKLGLVGFSPKSIMPWVERTLDELRGLVKNSAGDEFDLLNRLMADVTFDLWVTADVGNRGNKPAHVLREPKRGEVAGRLIVSHDLLLLRPEYIRKWCDKHRADSRLLRDLLLRHQCFVSQSPQPRDLMVGIPNVAGLKGRFWELDTSKLEMLAPAKFAEVQTESNVVPLRPADVS